MSTQLAIDFDAAMAARDLGMQRSVDRANREESEWSGQALGLLMAYAARVYPDPFLIEKARAWAESVGLPPPPDARAWGSVTKRAAVKNRIEKVGAGAAASSNCSLKPLWRHVAPPTTTQGEPK